MALLLFMGAFSPPVYSQFKTLTLTSEFSVPAVDFENNATKNSLKGFAAQLFEIKRSEYLNEFGKCLQGLNRVKTPKNLEILPWIMYEKLLCARKDLSFRLEKSSRGEDIRGHQKKMEQLNEILKSIAKKPEWLLYGSVRTLLKSEFLDSWLFLFHVYVQKGSRKRAWMVFQNIVKLKDQLSEQQLADVYKTAGELAFIEQNFFSSINYFQKSLLFKSSSEVQTRLQQIRDQLIKLHGNTPEKKIKTVSQFSGATEKEEELYSRMMSGLEAGDYLSVIEDAIKIINQFPMGKKAKESSEIIQRLYIKLTEKSGYKYSALKSSAFSKLKKVKIDWIRSWIESFYDKGFYQEVIDFSEQILSTPPSFRDLKYRVYFAYSNLYLGLYRESFRAFDELSRFAVESHYFEAILFYKGLSAIHLENYEEAVATLEKLVAVNPQSSFDEDTRYWLWVSLKKLNSEKVKLVAQYILETYPLSYYAFKIQANQDKVIYVPLKRTAPLVVDFKLDEDEEAAWKRFQLFLQAGWYREASYELAELPKPMSSDEKIIFARLWALTKKYQKAFQLFESSASEKTVELSKGLLGILYPKEYQKTISVMAAKNKLDADWIYALIRQESSFEVDAKSSAGALGLMQLLPKTAEEVSVWLGRKSFRAEDLLDPEFNLKMGAKYLSHQLKVYKGHLPMALASYNAGIGRFRSWINLRSQYLVDSPIKMIRDDELNEIWIDEMPWAETRQYVKSILRNILVYKFLSQGQLTPTSPLWK